MLTYFAITTPAGEGGISIIELFGPGAPAIITDIFSPRRDIESLSRDEMRSVASSQLLTPEPNGFYLGQIFQDAQPIDEVIIHYTPARDSFSGLDTIEINAHGGVISARLIGNLLRHKGAKELSLPAVINLAGRKGKLDAIQKTALEYLIQAPTPLAAAVLLDQYNGALSRAFRTRKNIRGLIKSAEFGLALTHPKRILILGRPNVGKSTLFNAILGRDRVITHHLAGTTRDTIEEMITLAGFPLILVDSAGVRHIKQTGQNSQIEKMSIKYARAEVSKADVVLLVIDPALMQNDANPKNLGLSHITRLLRKHKNKVIAVRNKNDIAPPTQGTSVLPALKGWPSMPVSALNRTGIAALNNKIIEMLGLADFKYIPGRPVIFTPAQLVMAKRLRK